MTSQVDPVAAYRRAGYRAAGLWTDITLGDLIPGAAGRHPERELFCFGDQRITYRQFDQWTRNIALDLVERGVKPRDRVLVQLPNRLEALALQVAAFRAGAVNVPVVPIYRAHEMRQIIADCRPAAVCSTSEMGQRNPAEELDRVLAEVGLEPFVRYVLDGERSGWSPTIELPRGESPAASSTVTSLPEPLPPDEPALLLYTSGTTSAPKGALLTSQAVMAHLANFREALDAGAHTVTLTATPLSHLSGFVAAVVFPAFVGGRSVVMPAWRPDEALEIIDRERVDLMMGATVFVTDLVDRYERLDAGPLHRLSTYAAAGAALAPTVVDRAARAGIDVVRAYGMTETAGVCAISSPDQPLERRRAWDGRLLAGMEIQAVDEERRPLPPGELGELRIRGAQLLTAYTDPEITRQQLDDDGWFYPGDLGRVDDQGWVQIAGRTKDIINRGGEKFSTLDIEQAVGSHPEVRAVAMAPIPDARLGEGVGAWLVVRDPADVSAEQLLEHLRACDLALQKFPVEWHLVTEIPTTASGKVQKHRLEELSDLDVWRTGPGRPSR